MDREFFFTSYVFWRITLLQKFNFGYVICIRNNLEYGNMFRICLNSFVLHK